NAFRIAMQNGASPGQGEAFFSCGAGIEVKRVADHFVERFMRVTKYDHVWILTCEAPLQHFRRPLHINDVMHQEFTSAKVDDFSLPIVQSDISVPENSGHWSDAFQLKNDLR